MSRPLTGSKTQKATGWAASLPTAKGSAKRVSWTFLDEPAADRWLAAGCEALTAGKGLPEPAAEDLAAARRHQASGTTFKGMADRWHAEYYGELRRGAPARATTARGHIQKIDGFMTERGLVLETMDRDQVKALQASLTRSVPPQGDPGEPAAVVPAGLDPRMEVTLTQAVRLPGIASRSTLKRRIKAGELVAVSTDPSGYRYRLGDLYADTVGAGGARRRGPRAAHGLSQDVADDVMWVFNEVCRFALDLKVAVPQDRASLRMHISDRKQSQRRQPVSLARCAEIARSMHVVHQFALFLMRVLALRISEAYGLRVGDVQDLGPGQPGIVCVTAQGGRKITVRDHTGQEVTVDHVEEVKNAHSRRFLVVPPSMMNLVRTVIAVFHTDTQGNIATANRLIPGLARPNAGGQSGFRAALADAARSTGVDCTAAQDDLDAVFSCTPHDMRRSALTELDVLEFQSSHIKRFAGHLAGPDVLHRHYLLDDPRLRPVAKIAEAIEREILDEVRGGLLVPTMKRCTTGNQAALRADAARIETHLVELGWLVLPTEEGGEPLLSAAEVARELGITVKTAREWMVDGRLPSVHWAARARGVERRARISDVLAARDLLASAMTLPRLAEEVGHPYHTVYQFVRANDLALEPWGVRDYVVPDDTAARVRAHYAEQKALHDRAIPLAVAASILGAAPPIVAQLIDDGVLVEDDRTHDGRRMVTRESVNAARMQRTAGTGSSAGRAAEPLMTWQEARRLTGLSSAQFAALVDEGTLTQRMSRRRRHITRSSLMLYLALECPERLQFHPRSLATPLAG